jgi:hypothetical protein
MKVQFQKSDNLEDKDGELVFWGGLSMVEMSENFQLPEMNV